MTLGLSYVCKSFHNTYRALISPTARTIYKNTLKYSAGPALIAGGVIGGIVYGNDSVPTLIGSIASAGSGSVITYVTFPHVESKKLFDV